MAKDNDIRIPTLRVDQWLPEWNDVQTTPDPPRRQPPHQFYVFSMSALDLKRISGIQRRDPTKPPAEDIGIQRRHMPDRSKEILRYLLDGFPLSRINKSTLVDQSEEASLRMPGWLPTAIIANILLATDARGPKGTSVSPNDVVRIDETGRAAELVIPAHCLNDDWSPIVHPVEIIDGQHRLWALEESDEDPPSLWTPAFREKIRALHIPVVAFLGLDRTWQAYLFYTINQLPKRIDTSLVFDLYPLLRTEEWLLRFEGPEIYRQTRAQDLAIILWSHPESPWRNRILRLGGRKRGTVTQASLIRSLMVSFIRRYKQYEGSGNTTGGLFGAVRKTHDVELGWAREQQAAFLILIWQAVRDAVQQTKARWAEDLRRKVAEEGDEERAIAAPFAGEHTLLASDQGSRCILLIMNDMFWLARESGLIKLDEFQWQRKPDQSDEEAVSDAMQSLRASLPEVPELALRVAETLASFDWRLFSALTPQDANYSIQASYRGSGGYRELRRKALEHLRDHSKKDLSRDAQALLELLGYDDDEGTGE